MKLTKTVYKIILFTLFCLNISNIRANEAPIADNPRYDSIQISLLTCSPHDEVYSLYGHTAIRYKDTAQGIDIAVNYGMFSFKKPYFVLRFVFGLTDYEMGIQTFEDFCSEYRYYGASVTEQVLNLTPSEKAAIYEALQRNSLPENRVYRYNYFYNNCTTKARDIILDNIRGKVEFTGKVNPRLSFRDMIHSCNVDHPWARFGNDLLLGVQADANTGRSEQQFLPANLMNDFRHAVIKCGGKSIPLVKETHEVVEKTAEAKTSDAFCPTPTQCFLVLLAIYFIIMFAEAYTGKVFWAFDATVLALCGLGGLILLAMVFSQHPTVRINFQILLLNPLFLYMAYRVVRFRKDYGKTKKTWNVVSIFVILALICSFFQQFADGMVILAFSLLLREQTTFRRTKNYRIYSANQKLEKE